MQPFSTPAPTAELTQVVDDILAAGPTAGRRSGLLGCSDEQKRSARQVCQTHLLDETDEEKELRLVRQHRMEELDEFAQFHRLSPHLRTKIRNYVDFQWSVTKGSE